MPRLGVNIDHVATVRQARQTFEPDPVRAAIICELAGADGIVAHLREDRRHMQDRDLELIRQVINIKLNFEMAATDEMVERALNILPEQVTLVPEKREELTTEGGLDVRKQAGELSGVVEILQGKGITVSLFIDPEEEQIKASVETGASAVEFHTGRFAESYLKGEFERELRELITAVEIAKKARLSVYAGHGLTYQNAALAANINGIEELNIGHTIIARAVLVGLERAVKDMIALVHS
jgi:pyridoxine 5-phosphate synthase